MKRAFFLIVLLCVLSCAGSVFAQESGNRIYGNRGYYNQQRRQPLTNTGTLNQPGWSIEASVLTNLKPDGFVAVFGVNEEAGGPAASNQRVNARIAEFARSLTRLGIGPDDIFVDFITQNRVYDYTVEGNQAVEKFTGFETKKTIAVRYKERQLFEHIVTNAAALQIFDVIKVDYIVTDFDAVRKKLFEEAAKIIKSKEQSYTKSFGITLNPLGLVNERYDAFYPSDSYERYQAFETGDAYAPSSSSATKLVRRKSFTFFYEPFEGSRFDTVLQPLGIEPMVQFSLYLRVQYVTQRLVER